MMIMIIYTLITIVLIIYKNNNDRSQTAVVPMESHALARTAHATRAAAKRDARNKVFFSEKHRPTRTMIRMMAKYSIHHKNCFSPPDEDKAEDARPPAGPRPSTN